MKLIQTNKGQVAKVSDVDYSYLSQFTWCVHKKGYFYARSGELRGRRMHRVVAERAGKDSPIIDHKDRDPSNNMRSNLRPATQGQNRANSRKDRNSVLKGVHKKGKRWYAQIQYQGQKHYLGYFDSPEEAHKAYCAAARKFHKDFAHDG